MPEKHRGIDKHSWWLVSIQEIHIPPDWTDIHVNNKFIKPGETNLFSIIPDKIKPQMQDMLKFVWGYKAELKQSLNYKYITTDLSNPTKDLWLDVEIIKLSDEYIKIVSCAIREQIIK